MYSFCLPFTRLRVGVELLFIDFHAVASEERVNHSANGPAEIAGSCFATANRQIDLSLPLVNLGPDVQLATRPSV